MNCLRRVRDRRVWDWVIRNCRISCLGRRKWFHIGAARDIGGKTKRGRLIYFLFLYTLLFLIFTYFPFPCITWHSDLSYCLDLITESLSSVSDEFWCTHCCPFHLYFSHLKTLYSFLWNVKEMFSESCGSVSLLWEKKKRIPANGWNWIFHPMQQKALVDVFCCCSCYYLSPAVVYTFSARWSNLEHTFAFAL